MASPPFVGLTGAVAAGKSEALAALGRLGAATIAADDVVGELLRTEELRDRLVERWGEDVAPDGEVDRARAAAIVFDRPEELDWLEAELHPLVGERIVAWKGTVPTDAPAAVVEVPLLFETGMEAMFDAVVCIVADDEQRAERSGAAGVTALEGREARQLDQAEKARRATHVISNDGSVPELESRLAELLPELARLGDATG